MSRCRTCCDASRSTGLDYVGVGAREGQPFVAVGPAHEVRRSAASPRTSMTSPSRRESWSVLPSMTSRSPTFACIAHLLATTLLPRRGGDNPGNDADPAESLCRVDIRRAGSGLFGVLVGLLGEPRRLASASGSSSASASVTSSAASSAGASSVVSSTSASATSSPRATPPRPSRHSLGRSLGLLSLGGRRRGGLLGGLGPFLVRAGFGSYFSVTSSMTAMGALSPLRGPILVIRV